jgi:branched-chain amino acid transport system substrate-binding protein
MNFNFTALRQELLQQGRIMMQQKAVAVLALAAVTGGAMLTTTNRTTAQQKEVVIGEQCDRTGATQLVGVHLCRGIRDYIDLINSKGGVEG